MRWGDPTSGKRAVPAPLEGNVPAVVVAGTLLWAVAFLVQLPFYGRYADQGHTDRLWTCLVGVGLGLLALGYLRRRDAARRRSEAAAGPGDTGPPTNGPPEPGPRGGG